MAPIIQPAETEQAKDIRQYFQYFIPKTSPLWVDNDVLFSVDEPDRNVQTETVYIFPESTVLKTASNG